MRAQPILITFSIAELWSADRVEDAREEQGY